MGEKEAIELDFLSRQVMLELMKVEQFQKLWLQMAERKLSRVEGEQKVPREPISEQDFYQRRERSRNPSASALHDRKSVSEVHPNQIVIREGFRRLYEGLCSVLETFSLCAHIVACCKNFEKQNISRESVTVYSVRVLLERFCSADHFRISQFELVARHIANLMRLFTKYISGPFNAENCAYLANNIFDILVKFYTHTQSHEYAICAESTALSKAIIKFDELICAKLDKVVLSHRTNLQNREKQEPKNGISKSKCRLSQSGIDLAQIDGRIALVPRKYTHIGRSFLVSPELEYARSVVRAQKRDVVGPFERRRPSF